MGRRRAGGARQWPHHPLRPRHGTTRTILRNLLFANGVCLAHDNQVHPVRGNLGLSRQPLLAGRPEGGARRAGDLRSSRLSRQHQSRIERRLLGRARGDENAELRPRDDHAGLSPPHGPPGGRATNGFSRTSMSAASSISARTAEILETLWDAAGENHPSITSMREHRGYLYLGGVTNNRIGRIKLRRRRPRLDGPRAPTGERRDEADRAALDRWFGRGDFSITEPPMDGAFRPNDRLDAAAIALELRAPDALAVTSRGLLVSLGRRGLSLSDEPRTARRRSSKPKSPR